MSLPVIDIAPLFGTDTAARAAVTAVVEPLPLAADVKREARWDEADLDAISGPYGDYLLGKVGKVFPGLKAEVL